MGEKLSGQSPWVWGFHIFLCKCSVYGSLCNWFTVVLDYFNGLQLLCASDGSGTSGYRFLIIHWVYYYFLFFVMVLTVCCSAPLEVVAGWFSWSLLELGIWYFSGADFLVMRGALDVLFWVDLIFPHLWILLSRLQWLLIVSCKCFLEHPWVLLLKIVLHVPFYLLLWCAAVLGIYENIQKCLW